MNNNIIYKKTSDYDSNSDLSTNATNNSEINLDDSVISINSDTDINNQIYKNNIDLRNNIDKDLKNNINKDLRNNIDIDLKNNIDKELKNDLKNENQIINNICINKTEDFKNNYLNEFLNFIELNDYDIDSIENTNLFNEIIKFFIIQNNLDENEVKIFADLVYKNKSFLKKNIENKINNINTQENFNINTQDNNVFNENNNSTFFNKLVNNDINTWIFLGIILISIIMIIMIILQK